MAEFSYSSTSRKVSIRLCPVSVSLSVTSFLWPRQRRILMVSRMKKWNNSVHILKHNSKFLHHHQHMVFTQAVAPTSPAYGVHVCSEKQIVSK
jgi:hypothetical protein